MRYVFVSPYSLQRRSGVTTYIEHARMVLAEQGMDTICLSNEDNLPWSEYQVAVRDALTARFRPDEVLIEAPEVACPTLRLPPEYRVHVRLHCPSAFVRWHNRLPADPEQFDNELRVARSAHVVSCPSYALLRELQPYLDTTSVHVYKNPPPVWDGATVSSGERRHDVVFMGNFSRLKGVDFLNPLLARLPPHYSVKLVGRESDRFQPSAAVRCSVAVAPHRSGPERLGLLAQARVVLSLSRFENCSMMVLECLTMGTVVAGWNVGGHAEIAGPRLLRLVPLGRVAELASIITAAIDGAYPPQTEFRAAAHRVMDDFRRGWSHVWRRARDGSDRGVYRGLDCRGSTRGPAGPWPEGRSRTIGPGVDRACPRRAP